MTDTILPTILPTGRYYVLERGDVRAEVGSIAAVLRSLTVGGADLIQRTPDDATPGFCNGIVLAPWPNRVRQGRWTLDGSTQQLDITEPELGGSLHGLLQFADYTVTEQSDAAITLAATIAPQHGWPFRLDTWVRYELTADGLTATHGVSNRSAARAPYATGTHAYLKVGDATIGDLELTVPASTYFAVDEHMDPTAELLVDGTSYDLRTPRRVGDLALDTAFGRVEHANVTGDGDDRRGDVAWLVAPGGARTTLWQSTAWGFVQVFSPRNFPSGGGLDVDGRHSPLIEAITVEPMTAPPDALNSGEGLVWLEPGETWQGSWGLRYSGGNEGE
jgi:aldose 1-epimerase